MIRITVERDRDGSVSRVTVKGHANYGEHGRDLVCAAVSGITIGMANAIEQLTDTTLHQPDDGEGKVDLRIPEDVEETTHQKLTLLLEATFLALKNVADEYPAYVSLT
ncbi:ribosomal-processing cysteine protease Prp [Risungbinella massiliensis]|uniref:ribosomal-processing cysteine protease Prp n=1 Tax=Risungbinella massiliensis TaxID=1329796 RepID=UPI0005CC09E7|nr:ribosomal-processing cysteine protease Prp [Risungbinella massiliensis]